MLIVFRKVRLPYRPRADTVRPTEGSQCPTTAQAPLALA